MTNPYTDEPYMTAWLHGHDYGGQNPGSGQPTPPDFSGWGYDATVAAYIGQVWQEGVLAGREATASPGQSVAPSAGDATHHEGPHHDSATHADDPQGGHGPQVRYEQSPAPGPVAVVEPDGTVKDHGHATELSRAGTTHEASHALEIAVEAALAGGSVMPGIGPLVEIIQLSHSLGCTVAIGLDGELAAIVGADAGAGVYYTPSGEFGVYASLAADLGAVIGASIAGALTVVHGGSDALAGNCLAVTLSGGEGVVGSGSLLFSADAGGFLGVALSAGVGVGIPFNAFAQYSHTWIKPLN